MPPPALTTVVLASRNQGKVLELQRLLAALPWRLVGLDQVPGGHQVGWEESGATYRQNAAIKALAVLSGTGLPALADDSGLELQALGGWPGLRTARWMGEAATSAQLLWGIAERVAQLPTDARQASFVCVLALACPRPGRAPQLTYADGRVHGTLLAAPRGAGGFGYDPIFVPRLEERTMAEMDEGEKDGMSHRGRAARALIQAVAAAEI